MSCLPESDKDERQNPESSRSSPEPLRTTPDSGRITPGSYSSDIAEDTSAVDKGDCLSKYISIYLSIHPYICISIIYIYSQQSIYLFIYII